jgi:hypothetical protein
LRIYPDSSDLINLSRGTAAADITDLARRLAAHCHQFVFSLETLIEVVAPLRNGRFLEVRRDLNRLEELPHTFVNEGRIYQMELLEAVRAFERGREYESQVIPFALRLDEAIDIHGMPQYIVEGGRRGPTEMIVNFGIAEVIGYLWNYDRNTFEVQRRREQEWISVMQSDRTLASPPALRDHFVTAMVRNLATHGVRPPAAAVRSRSHVGCMNQLRAAPAFGWYTRRTIVFAAIERPVRALLISSTWRALQQFPTSTTSSRTQQ